MVTLPLILLAIPSVLIGFFTAGPMLFGSDWSGKIKQLPFFLGAIEVDPSHDVMVVFDVGGSEVAVAVDNIEKAKLVPDWIALGLAPAKDKSGRDARPGKQKKAKPGSNAG